MAIPAICHAIKSSKDYRVTVVVSSSQHYELLKLFISSGYNCIIRNDGGRFADYRLFFKLLFQSSRIIVAPLIADKSRNKVFFSLLPVVLYSPLKLYRTWGNRKLSYSLSSFPGHQVNYFLWCVSHATGSKIMSISHLDLGYKTILPNLISGNKLKVVMGISCGEREKHKIPSPEYFAGLVNYLNARLSIEFHIVATELDMAIIDRFKVALSSLVDINWHLNKSFKELSQMMPTYHVGISGMSGQGHLMSAFGLPMVIFSGVTNPKESSPFTERAVICRHDFACGPCYQESFLKGCGKINCMDDIPYESIFLAINYLMANSSNGKDWYISCKENTLPIIKVTELIGKKIVR